MSPSLGIAVADDERRMRDYYQETLTHLGHRVTCAVRTGRELVERCREARPDLIIAFGIRTIATVRPHGTRLT